MRKSTRKLFTIASSLILALSTSFTAFAATATDGNDNTTKDKIITESNVYFYVFSPLDKDEETKKGVIENPCLDSPENVWTKQSTDMTGSIEYLADQYEEYDIENSSNPEEKNAGYINTDDIKTILADLPSNEAIKEAVENRWSYEYDTTEYGVKWLVVKYAHNTWHVDGIIVPLSELEETTTEETTTEETTTEETATEEVTTEETTTEETTTEETTTEETITEETTTEETTTEETATEEVTTEETTTEETTAIVGVDIIEEDIPLSDGKDNNKIVVENPTTAVGVDIIEEDIPLSDGAPQTGDNTTVWVFAFAAVLAAGMIVVINAKKTNEE